MHRLVLFVAGLSVIGCLLVGVAGTAGDERTDDSRLWIQTVDRGVRYLKGTQAEDGSWSREKSPGVTGVVLTGLLHTGRISIDEPTAIKLVKGGFLALDSLADVEAQDIADAIGIDLEQATKIHTAAKTALASTQ